MSRIVIIGSSGLIGSSLVHFIKDKDAQLETVELSSKDIDLCVDGTFKILAKLIHDDDHVIFLSAYKKDFGNNIELFKKNIAIAQNVAFSLKKKKLKSLIFLSSAGVYGEEIHNLNITELTPTVPNNYYCLSKLSSEKILNYELSEESFPITILRPPLVYGPRDKGEGYGPIGFTKKALRSEQIILWGDGSEVREFLYVNDLCEVILRCIKEPKNRLLNVVSSTRYNFQDVLNILSKKFELNISQKERSKEKVDNAYDNQILLESFKNIKFTNLESGIDSLIKGLNE